MEIAEIDCVLSYGKLLTKRQRICLYVSLSVSFLFPIISILIAVTVLLGGMDWNENKTFVVIFGNIFSLFLFSVLIWKFVSNRKIVKAVNLWLDDVIILNHANVSRMDIVSPKFKPFQVMVVFEFEGQRKQKLSAPGNIIMGYQRAFLKYAGKKIQILYSRRYDQVLIPKQKISNR